MVVASAVDRMLLYDIFVRNKREETYFIHITIIFCNPLAYMLHVI
jgi:hypothetical protein